MLTIGHRNRSRGRRPPMTARMEYTNEDLGIVARWHGGAYIDVYDTKWPGGLSAPFACVNVWNYATDRPTIPPTLEGLTGRMARWINEQHTDTSEEE